MTVALADEEALVRDVLRDPLRVATQPGRRQELAVERPWRRWPEDNHIQLPIGR